MSVLQIPSTLSPQMIFIKSKSHGFSFSFLSILAPHNHQDNFCFITMYKVSYYQRSFPAMPHFGIPCWDRHTHTALCNSAQKVLELSWRIPFHYIFKQHSFLMQQTGSEVCSPTHLDGSHIQPHLLHSLRVHLCPCWTVSSWNTYVASPSSRL